MWFESLVGFREESPDQVRGNLELDGTIIRSLVNGRELQCGRLEIPSLGELQQLLQEQNFAGSSRTRVSEHVGDVRELHADPANAQALFQVASQFNLLEMMHPSVSPERGIDIYERDRTQGPACAMSCGGATMYRNYFVPVGAQVGQTTDNQVDCIRELGVALGNADGCYWTNQNGYALPSKEGLHAIAAVLVDADEDERDGYRKLLRIGAQWDAGVSVSDAEHAVSQVFCSALPVAYSSVREDVWEPFARLVLEAAYEATMICGVLNARRTGNNIVFLTLLGGGAFGNANDWITDAIARAVGKFEFAGLDVRIVSYGQSQLCVQRLLAEL